MFDHTDIFAKQGIRYSFILVVVISLSLLATCSGSDQPAVETMHFKVDLNLLGEIFADSTSGLFLQAPTGWRAMSDTTIQQVQTGIESSPTAKGRPAPKILALFSVMEKNAHLAVGRYDPGLLPAEQDSVLVWQKEVLHARFVDDEVLHSKFLHNQIMFEQLMVAGKEYVVIKLFPRRKGQAMCHIEYVVHRAWYETQLRAIESSIGSISFNS